MAVLSAAIVAVAPMIQAIRKGAEDLQAQAQNRHFFELLDVMAAGGPGLAKDLAEPENAEDKGHDGAGDDGQPVHIHQDVVHLRHNIK